MSRSHPDHSRSRRRRHGGAGYAVSERELTRDLLGHTTIDSLLLTTDTVLLARLPMDDHDDGAQKIRPCVVREVAPDTLMVGPVTSSPLAPGRLAYEPAHWDQAGLARPSVVLLRRVRIDRRADVISVLGTLHPADAQRLRAEEVTTVSAIPTSATVEFSSTQSAHSDSPNHAA